MPLTDLIRYFNTADSVGGSTLYPEGERAAAWCNGLRLGSLFQPIVDLRAERIVGHRASLRVVRDDGVELDGDAAYALCGDAAAVVHFDRLCRTLHALNFLAQRRHAGGYLQVSVHPRHLLAVPSQHGLVYEAILKRCGLAPEDIVFDIDLPAPDDGAYLAALDNYRRRGYRPHRTMAPTWRRSTTIADAATGWRCAPCRPAPPLRCWPCGPRSSGYPRAPPRPLRRPTPPGLPARFPALKAAPIWLKHALLA